MADEATTARRGFAEDQRRIAQDVADLRSRVAAIETLLRQVG